jgi:hypothetical protein
MRRIILTMTLLALGAAACSNGGGQTPSASQAIADSADADSLSTLLPRFTPGGELILPEGWEAWVLAGTSMGLTYNEPASIPAPGEPPGSFLNVYIQPWAYERFMETGEYPEGTMFVLAASTPSRKADPARGGFYQGDLHLMEVHLKKKDLHESGWGFYGFGEDSRSSPMIPGEANCYSCHRDEAAFDQVFAQFYPRMRERLGLASAETDSAGGGS